MSDFKEVTVSGAVGKQVYATTYKVKLLQAVLYAPTSAATVVIRDGNASGDTVLSIAAPAQNSTPVPLSEEGRRFDKGMHVKVIGLNAKCYLEIA